MIDDIKLSILTPKTKVTRKTPSDGYTPKKRNKKNPVKEKNKENDVSKEELIAVVYALNEMQYYQDKNIHFELIEDHQGLSVHSYHDKQMLHRMTPREALDHFENIGGQRKGPVKGGIIDLKG